MEANFLKSVHWNFLKILEHVTRVHMHDPMKQIRKMMHIFLDMVKTIFFTVYFGSHVAEQNLVVAL